MPIFMICSTLLAVIVVAYYILKKYNPIFVFFLSGIILLIFAFLYHRNTYTKNSKQRVYKLLNVLPDSYLLSQRLLKVSFLEQGLLS